MDEGLRDLERRAAHDPSLREAVIRARARVHHLFVTGSASLTEFLAGPLELEVPDDPGAYARMAELDRRVRALAPPTARIPSCQVVTYGRLHLHRATRGLFAERRLLGRVTETDVRRPFERETPVAG